MKQRPNVWIQQGTVFCPNIELNRAFQKYRAYCQKKRLSIYISSGNDSDHSMGSMHFSNDAVDMLNNGCTVTEIRKVFGASFDIVSYSWGHHVEFDPKK